MIANALCVNLDIVNATEHGMADVYEVRPSNTDVIDTVTIYRNKDHYDALVPVIAEPSNTIMGKVTYGRMELLHYKDWSEPISRRLRKILFQHRIWRPKSLTATCSPKNQRVAE